MLVRADQFQFARNPHCFGRFKRLYGKFVHSIFRTASLLKSAIEKRQPNKLQHGSD